jgi:hypothetical protein
MNTAKPCSIPLQAFQQRVRKMYTIFRTAIIHQMEGLRKFTNGAQVPWTKQEILAGLNFFYQQKGRYPTANEIDQFEYLPSSRSIQRTHGGLVSLRKELIPNAISDYTAGEYRKAKAQEADKRAKKYEEEFYDALSTHFRPIAIHEHKIIRPGNIASDFFIYLTELEGIVIDLFYAQDMRSLINIVNIKLKRYINLPYDVYFVLVGNPQILEKELVLRMANRSIPLPMNIKVVTEDTFKSNVIPELKTHSIYVIA